MKTLAFCALLVTVSVRASTIQDMPPTPQTTAEHKWLQQLVGEWDCKCEISGEPGTEPAKMEGTEKSRSIGDFWVLCEGHASFGGTPINSMMTLGYDPLKKAFVGTWVDSVQTHLWTYRGTLDEAKKKLTLEADGPSCFDPTKTAHFHDVMEIIDADHKVMTSSILGEDGTWTQIMRAAYSRKK